MHPYEMNSIEFDQTDCRLEPGALVEHSGVYEICHADERRATVVLTRGSLFPYCKQCGEAVRFKLLQSAPHIAEDPDFMEDAPKVDNSLVNKQAQSNVFPTQLGLAHGFRFCQELMQTWRSGSGPGSL